MCLPHRLAVDWEQRQAEFDITECLVILLYHVSNVIIISHDWIGNVTLDKTEGNNNILISINATILVAR